MNDIAIIDQSNMFQSKIFSQLKLQDFPIISDKFLELAEDMQDYYRIQTNGKNIDRSDYLDENSLDKILWIHADKTK